MEAELQAIRDMVSEAALPADVQRNVLWGLDQLPVLYRELNRTYESRFSDRILGSVQGIVKTLTAPDAGAEAPALAVTIILRLRAMHDQHGISVALKLPPVPKVKPSRKKKSV